MRLNAAHDVHSVLGVMTEEARNLIGAHQAAARLTFDRASPAAMTRLSFSDEYEQRRGRGDVPSSAGISFFLEDLDKPVRMTRDEFEAHYARKKFGDRTGDQPSAGGWLAAPLLTRAGLYFGLIQLSDKYQGEFTDNDQALIVQLAQMASTAVENARLYEELREKDQRKDEFLAMLAHELRNPLSAINHAVRVTTVSRLSEQIDWCMDLVGRQVKHLGRLIDDLLDVSRITRGRIHLRTECIDPCWVLNLAVEAVRPLVEQRKHHLSVSCRPSHPVEADPTRLEQILVNLLTNAAKYTESGGHIWVTAGQEGSAFVIKVRDDGVGVPPGKLPQMFELFAQGDRSLARSEGGLGIGLTLARTLTEMHGGSLTASSEGVGRGSEFVVRLPAAAGPAKMVPKTEAPPPVAKKPARVLVVDDNADTARGMALLLKFYGHDVQTANDGRAAINLAQVYRPDIVLLDIGLPGMDGYQVAARLRQEEALKGSVIIAVSGYGQEEDRRRSREAGFDHHMVKPVDHNALLRLLAQSATAAGADSRSL